MANCEGSNKPVVRARLFSRTINKCSRCSHWIGGNTRGRRPNMPEHTSATIRVRTDSNFPGFVPGTAPSVEVVE